MSDNSFNTESFSGYSNIIKVLSYPVSVNELSDNRRINLYPIPTEDLLNIELYSKSTGNVVIQLFNLNGQVVYNKSFVKNTDNFKESIHLSKLISGSYLTKITLNNETFNQLIVKL